MIDRRAGSSFAAWCAAGMIAVASFALGVAQATNYLGIGIGAGFVLLFGLALVAKASNRHKAAVEADPGAEKLLAAEAMYRAMVDTAVDAIITIDHRGVIDSFNRAAERLFGYSAAEVIDSNVRILMPEPYASEHDQYLANYLRTGERHIIGIGREVVARRKDGSQFPIDLAVAEWFRGGERHFTGIIRDLTERKAAEQTLRVSEQRFRSLFTNSPLGKALIGPDQRIREVNPALCRMLGFAADELEGRALSELAAAEDRASFAKLGVLLNDRSAQVRFEQRFVTKQGKIAWASIHAAASPGTDDPERLFFVIVDDITDRIEAEAALHASEQRLLQLQAELLHVSRLSELGQMAATVAHELNQPLAAAANYLSGSRRMLDGERYDQHLPAVRDGLARAAQEMLRAGQIIRRMRSFVARGEADKRVEDLWSLIEETSELVSAAAKQSRVELRLQLDPEARYVLADRVQIQQVIRNLLRNAFEAMDASEQRLLTISTRLAGPEHVGMSIADTGAGISPTIVDDLFQPFVSTKSSGLGLGLSICRTIIEGHGGRIWVEPNRAAGTVFHVTLPRADRS